MQCLENYTHDVGSVSAYELLDSLHKTTKYLEEIEKTQTLPSKALNSIIVDRVTQSLDQILFKVKALRVSSKEIDRLKIEICSDARLQEVRSNMDPEVAIANADQILESCVKSLKLVDLVVLEEVERSGKAAIESLEELKNSKDCLKLFLNVRLFGAKLVKFIENSVKR